MSYQNIFIGILFVIILGLFAYNNHLQYILDIKSKDLADKFKDFNDMATELKNTKTELENTKTELENTKTELEKTTSFLYVIYLSFARVSAAIRSENLIRNQTKTSAPPIVDEIGEFLDKYEKFGSRSEFVKIESEFKTKLDQLTSLNIKSIDLIYK